MELSELPGKIVEGLKLVRANLNEVGRGILLASLRDAVRRYVEVPGKMVRPLFSLATAYSLDEMNVLDRRILAAATSIELVHLVSLIQDDIVDGHFYRRGVKTPFAEYGVEIALLASDYLIAQAVKYAVETGNPRVVKYFALIAERLPIGQAIDVELKRRDSVDLDAYLESIAYKTASLIEASFVSPFMILGAEDLIESASQLGKSIGVLYQLIDDVFDLRGLHHGHDITEREVGRGLRAEEVEDLLNEWARRGSEALERFCASVRSCDVIRRLFYTLLNKVLKSSFPLRGQARGQSLYS